jgi:hypothetical protein
MAVPVTLSNTAATLLPPTITGPIFAKATETSAVMNMARRIPLAVNAQTAIPVSMDVPAADWVGEGGVKAVGQVGVGVKTMTGKKVALIVPVSTEVVMTNPGGVLDLLRADLPTALARAFDYAAINGKSIRTGAAGPFTEYLALANSTVALGTATQANGGLYNDIVTAAGRVIDKNYDVTGIAADPRLKIDGMLATDTTGRPLFLGEDVSAATINSGALGGTIAGFPAAFGKGVSGRYWRGGDQTQTVTLTGAPTGGSFVLSSGGNSTTVAFNAAAATIQTAVQAWGGIYAAVTVTGGAGGPWTITFPAPASNVQAASAPFSTNSAGLTGGTNPKAVVAATASGGTDSLLRAVLGDWSQAAYGVGMDITVKVDESASFFDGTTWHSAFQENLTLFLCEAYFGFVMGSLDAFALLTKGTAAF